MNPCEEFLRHAADCEEMAKARRFGEQTDLESDGRAVAHVCLENRKPSGAPQGAGNAEPSGYRPSLDAALNQIHLPAYRCPRGLPSRFRN
jgi:hypothetical protein